MMLVVMMVPVSRTPRQTMHRCCALRTTANPFGLRRASSSSASMTVASSCRWCCDKIQRPVSVQRISSELHAVRCLSIELQACSASANVVKGEPAILIAL